MTELVETPDFFGREISPQVWRFSENGTRLRLACVTGNLSVWEEGRIERELFRINLGVLKAISKRAESMVRQASRNRLEKASDLCPLSERSVREIWAEAARDPEVRFRYSPRMTPSSLGGWRHCLELAAKIMEARGLSVPWSNAELIG